jgi:hypothetical protein
MSNGPVLYPYTTLTLHESTKYEIVSHLLISGMEECKIPAWARDKMFRHKQGAFSFLELQISRGEIHFDKLFLQCTKKSCSPIGTTHRLNMQVDYQSLFGLHVT